MIIIKAFWGQFGIFDKKGRREARRPLIALINTD